MRTFLLMVLCAILIAGCSQGSKNPAVPSNGNNNFDGAPVIGLTDTGDGFNAIGVLGVYELTVNPSTMEVNLVPKRSSSAIGDSYIISGAAYFTIAPCAGCLTVSSYSLGPDGALIITFLASHPFDVGNPAEPPSGRNRNDLDIFDTAAVVVPNPGGATPTAYTKTGASVYTGICANADGYTTELANVTTDPAAYPFFLVVDDSTGTSTYNKLGQGTASTFDIQLDLSGGAIPPFDIYLTFGYGSSAKKAQRLTPKYYNPEFNQKAAWKIGVTPPTTPWLDNDAVGTKTVLVQVWDWQQNSVVSATVPYADETVTTTVFKESKVASVSVEIPGMNSTLPTQTVATSGTGAPADPLVYTFAIANENLIAMGTYTGLAKVLDSRIPDTTGAPGSVDALIHNPGAPAPTEWKIMPEFAAYQTFLAEVSRGCGPITGRITNPALGNYETIPGYADGQTIAITVTASSVGSTIALYEADFDYTGTFAADASNTTGIFLTLGPCAVPAPCASNVPRTFQVAFRATDNCVPPNVTIFKIFTGIINYCKFTTPVGDVTLTVNRAAGSYAFDVLGTNSWLTLGWAALPGAAEYAVYCDTVPGNYALPAWTIAELTDGLVLVGTSTTNTFNCPGPLMTTAKKYLAGNTYIVRGRSAVGLPATECTTNSELAFIMTTGFETVGSSNMNPEGWVSNSVYAGATYYYNMHTEAWNPLDTLSYRWGFQTFSAAGDTTVGSTHRVPRGIPTSQRRIDLAAYLYQFGSPGIFFVTSASQPTQGTLTFSMMEWVNAYNTAPYYAYTGAYATYQPNITLQGFVDVGGGATPNVSWYTAASPNRQRVGANFDTGSGNPAHDFVGIEKVAIWGGQDYPNIDDVAFLHY